MENFINLISNISLGHGITFVLFISIVFIYFKYIHHPFWDYVEDLVDGYGNARAKLKYMFSMVIVYLFALYVHPIIKEKLTDTDIERIVFTTFEEINNSETFNLTFNDILKDTNTGSSFPDSSSLNNLESVEKRNSLDDIKYIKHSKNKNGLDALKNHIYPENDKQNNDLFKTYNKNKEIDFHRPNQSKQFDNNTFSEDLVLEKIIKAIQMKFPRANKEHIEDIYQWSRYFNIDPFYAYGKVAQESSFNPNAISNQNAYGLFQVLPKTANDVMEKVFQKNLTLSINQIKKPYTNIGLGTGYIYLLRDHHFKYVTDEKKRFILMSYSYFGGIGNILKIFYNAEMDSSKNMKIAQEIINQYDLENFEETLISGLYKKKYFKTLEYPKLIFKHRKEIINNYRSL